MTVSINLPADLELTLRRRATEAGQDVDAFVRDAVVERLSEAPRSPARLSPEDLRRQLEKIMELHAGAPIEFDDSRESIYAGRGE